MKTLSRNLFTVFVMLCLSSAIQAQYALTQTAIAGGGMSNGAGGTYALDATTEQAAAGGAIRGDPYSMTVGFWNFTPTAPTAAGVSVSGRVTTAEGQGIRSARLVLTDAFGQTRAAQTGSFGYFRFENIPVGQTYILTVYSKRFTFSLPSQVINLTDDAANVNFTSEP